MTAHVSHLLEKIQPQMTPMNPDKETPYFAFAFSSAFICVICG
jgi:hypothetical protein